MSWKTSNAAAPKLSAGADRPGCINGLQNIDRCRFQSRWSLQWRLCPCGSPTTLRTWHIVMPVEEPSNNITSSGWLQPRWPYHELCLTLAASSASMLVRKPNADTVETNPIRPRSRDVVYFASLNGAEVCHIFCTENVTSNMARRRWDRLSSNPLKMNP